MEFLSIAGEEGVWRTDRGQCGRPVEPEAHKIESRGRGYFEFHVDSTGGKSSARF